MTRYGSDVMVELLQALQIEFIAMNPGASFRGLHESLVDAGDPELIMTLHEEVAVGIAHGFAKAAGRPMGVALHNLVGLQHASMAIFNAFSDSVPMMVLGGAGPSDTTRRRPWIDSVHTPNFQNLAVRDIVKWDAEPRTLNAVPDALIRAYRIALTQPQGPTYVALDVAHQELDAGPGFDLGLVDTRVPSSFTAPTELLAEFAELLAGAENPVIVADYVGRTEVGYQALIALAERLAAPVIDMQARHNFPNTHWADATTGKAEVLREADVVLVVEPRELALAIGETNHVEHGWSPMLKPGTTLLVIGLNDIAHRGFIDKELLVRDSRVAVADSSVALPQLVSLLGEEAPEKRADRRERLAARTAAFRSAAGVVEDAAGSLISPDRLVAAVGAAVQPSGPWQLAFPSFRSIARRTWTFDRFNAHLGGSGGAGLAYGPAATVGAALAHRDNDTLVVSLQPDGDLLFAPMALWTAAHHDLPMLMVVENNRSYGADRLHQARVGKSRGRSEDKVDVGIDIEGPHIDIAAIAAAQGARSWTVEQRSELEPTLAEAVAFSRKSRVPAVVVATIERPTRGGLG